MSEALDKVKRKIEELRDDGKRLRSTSRDTLRSSRQKPGERLMEREGPLRRFFKNRERPILKQLKNDGPLRGLLKKDE